jgi:5-methyltetrahydrofolate--homocysteine methyltransferase
MHTERIPAQAKERRKMIGIIQALETGRILLCDGAMGTQLYRRGLPLKACPEEWNLSHPDDVQAVSAEYIASGSDIVETNTLGAAKLRLAHFGLADKVEEINQKSAQLARNAAGDDHYVFASVGPSGEFIKPLGPRTEMEIIAVFAEQMKALALGGVDALCIETQISLNEALAAVKAAKENTDLPVIVTFTFNKTAAGYFRTIMGESPEQIVDRLTAAGADVLGSNCGWGPEQMLELCRKMRPLTNLPLMFQPNAGLPSIENGQTIFKATPQEMADACLQLSDAGAGIIGGCCGAAPAHVAAMRKSLDLNQR